MDNKKHIRTGRSLANAARRVAKACIVVAALAVAVPVHAQHRKDPNSKSRDYSVADSLWANSEGGFTEREQEPIIADTLLVDTALISADSVWAFTDTVAKRRKRDWDTWRPNPKKAMWLALVLPGAGQIYNRKYWKLPIFYGGFVGCVYAMRWNNMMYKDYAQAYLDIMDDDPETQSYNQFLHLGNQVTESNTSRYQELFRKRKDRYRRWRDLSFFVLVGVYALSVIDAYVDASLSEFDISPDLSFRWSPAVLNGARDYSQRISPGVGMNCSLNF